MAPINRYTTRNRFNQFQPLSFEDFATVPMAYQEAEDQTYQALEGLNTYIKALPQDRPAADELQQGLNQGINALTDQLSEGYDPSMSRQLINLRRKRQDLINPGGDAYKIEQSLANRQAFVKGIEERDDLSEENKRRAISLADKQYRGYGEGLYSGWNPSADVNVAEKLLEATKDIPASTIATHTGWMPTPDPINGGMRWTKGTQSVKQIPAEVIQYVASNYATQDPEIMSYLRDQARMNVGLEEYQQDQFGNIVGDGRTFNPDQFDENQYSQDFIQSRLQDAVNTAVQGRQMIETKNDQDLKLQSGPPEWLYNQTNTPQTPFYEEEEVEYINRDQNNLSSDLERIGTPKAKPPYLSPKERRDANISDEMWKKANRGEEYTFDDLDKKSQEQYNFIAESLLKTGEYNFDKYSPEMREVVDNYLKSNANRPRTNLINTTDVYTTYGQNSIGTHKSDSKKQGEAIWNNRFNRNYYNPNEPQEGIKTYREAVEEGWIEEGDNMNQSQFTTAGYYDARNYLPEQLESDAFVSPYVVNTDKGNRLFVTRSESERNTPTYKTDIKFNKFWMNLDKYPNIPITLEKFKDGSSIEVLNQGNRNYLIQTLDKNGNYISEPQIIEGDNNLRKLF